MIVNAGGNGKGIKSNKSAPKKTRKYCQIIQSIYDEEKLKSSAFQPNEFSEHEI